MSHRPCERQCPFWRWHACLQVKSTIRKSNLICCFRHFDSDASVETTCKRKLRDTMKFYCVRLWVRAPGRCPLDSSGVWNLWRRRDRGFQEPRTDRGFVFPKALIMNPSMPHVLGGLNKVYARSYPRHWEGGLGVAWKMNVTPFEERKPTCSRFDLHVRNSK